MTLQAITNRMSLVARRLGSQGGFVKGATAAAWRGDGRILSSSQTCLQRAWFSSYPPHEVVGLPSLSPTMESGSIANWNLEEGAAFAPGDVFCSVETDKATVDFEAQEEGFVAKILVRAPTEVKVGDPIMVIVDDESKVAAFKDFALDAAVAAAPVATPPPAAAAAATPPPPAAAAAAPSPTGGRVVASPLAHMLAKELGYNLSTIPGTGPGGRIIAADVKEFQPSATAAASTAVSVDTPAPAQAVMAASAPAQPIAGAGYTDYPLSEEARQVADRLVQSKRNVPHYYLTVDVSVDELLKLRSKLNKSLGKDATPLGVYEIIIKAAAMAMTTVPSVNASWMDSVVRVYDSVDINVVIGSGDSLHTPVIADCASKGLKSISKEMHSAMELMESSDAATAVGGGVGTFTIMNLGMYGIKSCAPIIREPQSCSLAIGSLENRIVPNDSTDDDADIYKESVVFTATLSCDHRVVDGAVGAQWLAAFKSHIENPSTLLL